MDLRGPNNKALAARKWAWEVCAKASDLRRNAAGMENATPRTATTITIPLIVSCMRGSRIAGAS
jgi:hypothetical protein